MESHILYREEILLVIKVIYVEDEVVTIGKAEKFLLVWDTFSKVKCKEDAEAATKDRFWMTVIVKVYIKTRT